LLYRIAIGISAILWNLPSLALYHRGVEGGLDAIGLFEVVEAGAEAAAADADGEVAEAIMEELVVAGLVALGNVVVPEGGEARIEAAVNSEAGVFVERRVGILAAFDGEGHAAVFADGAGLAAFDTGEAAVTDLAGEEWGGLQLGICEHGEDALAGAELRSEQDFGVAQLAEAGGDADDAE
jgi:hypothetical protein